MTREGARRSRYWLWLAVIAAAALVLRVVFVLVWRNDVVYGGDSRFYHDAANFLADGYGFVNPFAPDPTTYESANHPPLYWAYLGGVSWLGFTTTVGHMLASTLLGTATVWVTGLAGRAMSNERVGLIAAGLAAVYPNIWAWDGMLLSETMALLTVTLTIWTAYRYHRDASTLNAALLGGAIGLAMLSRAEYVLLVFLVAIPMMWSAGGRSVGETFKRLVPAGLAALLFVGPWVGHNLTRFEEPVVLSTGAEITLLTANCRDTYDGYFVGYWSLTCVNEVRDTLPEGLDESEEGVYFREYAFDFIGDNIDRLPAVIPIRWGRITHLYRPWQQSLFDHYPEGRPLTVARSGLLSFYALVPLAIAGGFVLRRRRELLYPVLAPLVVVMVTTTLLFAQGRYRAPGETALVLLAAVTVETLVRKRRSIVDPAPAGS